MSYLSNLKRFFILFVVIFCLKGNVYAQTATAREFNKAALVALQSGRYSEAAEDLKKAMEASPNWAEPYYNAANMMRLRKNDQKAFGLYKKAYELEPKNSKYADTYSKWLESMIKAAKNSNDVGYEMELKTSLVEVNPRKLDVGVEVVNYVKNTQNQKAAIKLAKKLADANSDLKSSDNAKDLGKLYLMLAENEYIEGSLDKAKKYAEDASRTGLSEAKDFSEKIRKEQKSAIDELMEKAEKAQKNGNFSEAEKYLDEAAEISPNSSAVAQKRENLNIAKEVSGVVNTAKNLIRNHKYSEAIDKMQVAMADFPEGSDAIKIYEDAVEKEKAFAKTIGIYGELPRTTKERANLAKRYFIEAEKFIEAENKKDAKLSYDKCIKLVDFLKAGDKELDEIKSKSQQGIANINKEKDYENYWEKAKDKRNSEDYDEVINLIDKIPEKLYINDERYIQVPSYKAEALWKTGKPDEAIKYADIQLGRQPDNNRAKFVKGSIFLERGEKDQANALFKEIYDTDPEYPELADKYLTSTFSNGFLILVGVVAFIAILLFGAWKLYKGMPEYLKNRAIKDAKLLLKKTNYDECINKLNSIKRLPNLTEWDIASISRILAQAFLKKGVYDKAIGECKHLITLNAKDDEAHIWLAQAYVGRRMLSPESLPELLNLFQKEPRNIALISLLGSHYTKQKNLTKEGVQILEQWLTLEPANPDVLRALGRYYLLMSRSDDKAMTVFQRLMEVMVSQNSIEPDFLLGIARMHLKMQHFEDALHLCEQVINADINNELVHSVLLDVYTKQGNLEDLISIYGTFLQENPYNVAFQNGLMEARKRIEALERGAKQQAENERRAAEAQRRREESERRRLEREQARLAAEKAQQAENEGEENTEEYSEEGYDATEYSDNPEDNGQSSDEQYYDESTYAEGQQYADNPEENGEPQDSNA